MRIAALYDIHGNLPALEAVLDDVAQAAVDRIVVGGDVLPGPLAGECLDRLLALGETVGYLRGNGEGAVLDALDGRRPEGVPEQALETVAWSARRLSPEQARAIAGWPATLSFGEGSDRVLFCHATPRSDTEIFTRQTHEERLRPIFDDAGAALVVCGHTHMQFDRRVGRTRVVNAGSVGMPFGEPGAYWALVDTEVTLRRTPYDVGSAIEAIEAAGGPRAGQLARRHLLEPPSEDEMLRVFAKAGI